MSDALILLPPSEGKAAGGDGPPWGLTTLAEGPLAADREQLVTALLATLQRKRGKLDEVLRYGSDDLLALAVETDLRVPTAPTMRAVERYTGVVLDGIDLGSCSATARDRLDRSVAFVSGLWGLVGAADPIPDYRVKIGAKVPRLGVLGTWWRSRVSPVVDDLATDRTVWNLLTLDHGRVWREAATPARVGTVEFTTVERGRRGVSNYHGKLLKGRFVRHLVDTDPSSVEAAAGFTSEGWKLDPAASTLTGDRPTLVFTAPEA